MKAKEKTSLSEKAFHDWMEKKFDFDNNPYYDKMDGAEFGRMYKANDQTLVDRLLELGEEEIASLFSDPDDLEWLSYDDIPLTIQTKLRSEKIKAAMEKGLSEAEQGTYEYYKFSKDGIEDLKKIIARANEPLKKR